jgi:hypothetical protein
MNPFKQTGRLCYETPDLKHFGPIDSTQQAEAAHHWSTKPTSVRPEDAYAWITGQAHFHGTQLLAQRSKIPQSCRVSTD